MNRQGYAVFFSLVLHALILTTVLATGHYLPVKEPLINFYFDIVTPPPTDSVKKKTVSSLQENKKKDPQPLRQMEAQTQSQNIAAAEPTRQETTPNKEMILPIAMPVIKAGESGKSGPEVNFPGKVGIAKVEGAPPSGRSGSLGAGSGDGKGSGEGISLEDKKARYVRQHSKSIQNRIQRNFRYPEVAKRMLWEGKAVVSFFVGPDGSVSDVKIDQSSGVPVLDKNACETVIKTAPFPRPPIPVELIIPLAYKLD